jgi:DNA-3-methyladenine glycosylase II
MQLKNLRLPKSQKEVEPMQHTFHKNNFHQLCEILSRKDKDLKQIIKKYNRPLMWTRPATFSTLIHIILEQQVSLASAKAAFLKLKKKLKTITPQKILLMTDTEMKACYFSRQKIVYAKHLSQSIISKKLNLRKLSSLSDHEIRKELKQVKGIGDWTADVYLLFALQRTDLFPTGDLAMMNSLREIKQLPKHTSTEAILKLAESWRPYRSIATMILWHYYLQKRALGN